MTHQSPDVNLNASPRSTAFSRGKYGRLFPSLPPQCAHEPDVKMINTLAESMVRMEVSAGKSMLPAGYTYFGQFIIHDMSFDPTTVGERMADPELLWNFRTPALDLDSVYGGGPQLTPYLYDEDWKFVINNYGDENSPLSSLDLQRNKAGVAMIVDRRNDENMIISRIHLLFQLLHNHFVDEHKNQSGSKNRQQIFEAAKRETIWHYQWIVLFDYLPRIIGLDKLNKLLNLDQVYENGRKYYDWRNEPFIPVEFASAAFRFGHAQVRDVYKIGSGALGGFVSPPANSRTTFADLRLKTQFPTPIDLKFFFFDIRKNRDKQNFAHKIEPKIASALGMVSHFVEPPNSDLQVNMDCIHLLTSIVEQKSYKKLHRKKMDKNILDAIRDEINDTLLAEDNAVAKSIVDNNQNIALKKPAVPEQKTKILAELIENLESYEEYLPLVQYFKGIPSPKFQNLAFRTLLKGCQFMLPSGQSVAQRIGAEVKNPTFKDVAIAQQGIAELKKAFQENTPLWYYILNEAAQLEEKGVYCDRLGEVGATIVGEVIVGLIEGDDNSFWHENRAWRPFKFKKRKNAASVKRFSDFLKIQDESKNFTMRDIIELLENKNENTLFP